MALIYIFFLHKRTCNLTYKQKDQMFITKLRRFESYFFSSYLHSTWSIISFFSEDISYHLCLQEYSKQRFKISISKARTYDKLQPCITLCLPPSFSCSVSHSGILFILTGLSFAPLMWYVKLALIEIFKLSKFDSG